jgi:hypothetical protein
LGTAFQAQGVGHERGAALISSSYRSFLVPLSQVSSEHLSIIFRSHLQKPLIKKGKGFARMGILPFF